MVNPVANLQRTAAEYKTMDKKGKTRFWTDGILNNALYILMLVFCIYTAIQKPNFLSVTSLGNLIVQVAAYLPMALGIAGCIVLTGTDLSAGRAVGHNATLILPAHLIKFGSGTLQGCNRICHFTFPPQTYFAARVIISS